MASFRQASFAGGELSPTLWGRSDLDKYAAGLRTCKNFFISRHGAALTRPGTPFISEVKNNAKKVRLIPFIYSDSTSYVLEFGDQYLRFCRNGAQVLSGGSPYEISTPYLEADLPFIKYVQSGDVIFLACKGYAPRELTRVAETNWTLATSSFAAVKFYEAGSWSFADDNVEPQILQPVPAGTGSIPAREWVYYVTCVAQETATGKIIETLVYRVTTSTNGAYPTPSSVPLADNFCAPDATQPVYVQMSRTSGLLPGKKAGYRILSYRLYKGRGTLIGFLGEASDGNFSTGGVPNVKFVDSGAEPDYSRSPPTGRNPFEVYNEVPTLVRTERPNCVALFEQRLMYGGTVERPDWLCLSQTNSYNNFDSHLFTLASDSAEYELSSRRREEIRSILGGQNALIFTDQAVWSFSGAAGGPFAANEIPEVRRQQEIGASWLDPIDVAGSVLFVRAKGFGVRDLMFDESRRSYAGSDLSILAQHLVEKYNITAWTYAEDPWSIVWCVRSDGKLLSLTYDRQHEVWAWALHETDGEVEQVCAVPETTEDVLYLVVKRTINGNTKRYVERMASRLVPRNAGGEPVLADYVGLDCCKSYALQTNSITGLGHLEGKEVYCLVDGVVAGPFTVTSGAIEMNLTLDAGNTHAVVLVGLRYDCDLETLDLVSQRAEIRGTPKVVSKTLVEVQESRGLLTGQSFDEDELEEWNQRDVEAGYSAPSAFTGLVELTIDGAWNPGGRACIRQKDPLPLTVLGLTREVDVGG